MTASPTPQPRAPVEATQPPSGPGADDARTAPETPAVAEPIAQPPQAEAPRPPRAQALPVEAPPSASAAPEPSLPASPRKAADFGGAVHRRQIRLEATLRSCCEQPDYLVELFGIDGIAEVLGLPAAAVERMIGARPSVRRRFAMRIRSVTGISLANLEAARFIPEGEDELMRAALHFAVAIRLAGTRRVLPRAAYQELNERYGVDAVAFAFERQRHLAEHAEILAEYREEETPSRTDLRLFVRSLAAHGNAAAPIVAIKLGFPASLATAPVANIDLALETGLPALAAAALAHAGRRLPPEAPARNEAAWHADASEDLDAAPAAEPGAGDNGSEDSQPEAE
jgi:hypothetical protein